MTFEETLITKLQRLPESERARLLDQVDLWLQQALAPQSADIQRAVAAVEQTWASIRLAPNTLRWIAESKELEYDIR
jgi:hypothetical protein